MPSGGAGSLDLRGLERTKPSIKAAPSLSYGCFLTLSLYTSKKKKKKSGGWFQTQAGWFYFSQKELLKDGSSPQYRES